MKVFISWSGDLSRSIAEIIRDWLPSAIQSVRPFFTPEDIEKGARWAAEIAIELHQSKIGIFVITKENSDKPWIMFEAGALSKEIDASKICVLLFGIENTDITGPLTQFQSTKFTRHDFRKLIQNINHSLGDNALRDNVLEAVFTKWWPDLEERVNLALESYSEANKINVVRDQKDMIEELLTTTRAIHKEISDRGKINNPTATAVVPYSASTYYTIMETLRDICTKISYNNNQIIEIQDIISDLGQAVQKKRLAQSYREAILQNVYDIARTLANAKNENNKNSLDDDIPF